MSTQPTPNTGLDAQLVGQLNALAASLTPAQLAWVGGYFTGLSAQNAGSALPAVAAAGGGDPEAVLTVLYGSQTGHARSVAEELRDAAQEAGLAVELVSMGKFKEKNLKKLKYVAVVTSTQGEGDPPDDALNLVEYMNSNKAPKLEDFQFAVLGLGDSSYEFYCKTGKDFDARLEELGGKRILDRVDLDVDFDDGAEAWIPQAVEAFKDIIPAGGASAAAPATGSFGATAPAVHYSRKKPLQTRLLTCQKITGRHSEKDIRHIEIDLEDSGLTYQPGDALGIYFKNDEELVNDLLRLLEIDPAETVHVNDEPKPVKNALLENYELTLLHPGFVTEYTELTEAPELMKIVAETESLRDYVETRQIIDVVREYPDALAPEIFIGLLRKLTPRLYSIASSQSEVEEEVHLTVGVVEYEAHGYPHLGGASGYLGHRLNEGEDVLIYVESNDNFRLPEDDNTPIIMIGPGTGVAPFRAFMQERAAKDAPGDSWLFFGNPHFTEDFLYQTEWQEFLEDGALTKIDLAFSRDQEHKVYVQHRITEQARELWNWIQRGAHIYVCGDESRMAHDVHQALLDVVAEKGGYSTEEAEDYLVQLRKDGRYQKDVY
ncbi:assimilatory sulfite reductase (NADPH) flavoprotein subunit [Pontiella agarivorans]|uniref:Assimilatory sulfite reductase (NADPH) flavoprotein subunit n=1 Tax=Pontiella agarivorans TaxID=3038953 RepID=A0ABU5MUP5_9BACT|nr:assimilatory sulfite reductase (NADPH) flavoprotein subunit [Pontiella agarivorans]MDZ8117935.1 assimilatory sulfite reductase (NADPH) flavoprotein subunit [Pontiella agarivorans]